MSQPDTLCIAAIQMCSRQDRAENLRLAEDLLNQSLAHKPDVVALPENFSFLDREGDKLSVVEDLEMGPSVRMLRSFARTHQVMIIGGSLPLRSEDENRVTNTCLVIGEDGAIVARYDKMHLFDIDLDPEHSFRESRYIAPGAEIVTVPCRGHDLGLSICYDLRFPELYRRLVMQGAKVLFVPSAFTHRTGGSHWETLLRARAIENLCYVVAPAQFGRHNSRRESYGHTMVVSPWGEILAQAPDQNGVISCRLDMAYLDDIRRRLPSLGHARLLP